MARPVKWTKAKKAALLADFLTYIDESDIPIIAEFAAQKRISRQQFYDFPEFSDAIKLCTTKKEAALESMALTNQINPTMAIFSLKQLGWRDKQEVEHSGSVGAPKLELGLQTAPEAPKP